MAASDLLVSLLLKEQDSDYKLTGAPNYVLRSQLTGEVNSDGFNHNGIKESWRCQVAGWAYEVVDCLSVDRDAVALTLNYMDRFVAYYNRVNTNAVMTSLEFRILSITAIYLAVKLHGIATEPFRLRWLVGSQNLFTCDDIKDMELQLAESLKWKLNPPLTVNFVRCFVTLLPEWHSKNCSPKACRRMRSCIYETAAYMAEVSILISDFSLVHTPSEGGYAAILTAMVVLEQIPAFADIFPPPDVLLQFKHNVYNATLLDPTSDKMKNALLLLVEACPVFQLGFFDKNLALRRSLDYQDTE